MNRAIKQYLEERGIKQSFLGERLGMSPSTVNALINGNRGISAKEYFQICDALNLPLDYFKNATAIAEETKYGF